MASVMLRGIAAMALGVGLTACGSDPGGPGEPDPPVVASVEVSPPSAGVELGQTTRLTAQLEDANGDPIQRAVTWTSSNASVATVDASGLVTGVATGTVTVTASAEGKSGAASVIVSAPATGVVLTSVSPSPLIEGQPATLSGRGFGLVASNNKVTIDGATASVTSASATTLQIVVPYTGCKPSRAVDVQVRLLATPSNVLRHPLKAPEVQMAVGDALLGRDPAGFCIQLPASPQPQAYLIGLQSISEQVSSLTPAVVAGLASPGAAPVAPPLLMLEQAPVLRPTVLAPSRLDSSRLRHRTAEARLRALDAEFLRGLGGRSSLRAPGLPATSASIPPGLQVGSVVPLRVPKFVDQCHQFSSITTVVRRITTRSIWLEDIANPSGGFSAAQIQSLSNLFENSAYDSDVDYFGSVSDLDGNGRIAIVITGEVNRLNAAYDSLFDLTGFVKAANFFATSFCPSSNEGEIIYFRTPDPAGRLGRPTPPAAQQANDVALLLAHEFVHVIQFGHQVLHQGVVSQPNWLLEAQATLAEEVVGHRVTGRAVGQNYGYAVAYEDADPVGWYRTFNGLTYYFGAASRTSRVPNAPEQCTWVALGSEGNDGPCASNDLVAYDVGWSFLRFLADRYGPSLPGGEKGLQRALVDAPVRGFAAIADAVGLPIDVLLAQWAAALYLDDRVPGLSADLRFSSWNLFDIEQGVVPVARLQPRERGFGGFSDQVSVRAGSTAYFRVSGAGHAATAIRVRDASGGNLPAWMRLWIVRIQ